ncbi:CDC42 small effector protein homolog [Cimex lectularius]|uniref:CRIB domain-containing protein n=1 Tax=Cimex lectularius TaxID=79782 RepID=A0A8I6RPW3_CIMLE|nr:CDC42 small effector protein homolog [Cimex lectularius]
MSNYQSGNMGGDIWVQLFSCCINQPAHQRKRQQRRGRIDRSMIGEPTNFRHTGHIGSEDVDLGNTQLHAIQNQMQSKGGYETSVSAVKVY